MVREQIQSQRYMYFLYNNCCRFEFVKPNAITKGKLNVLSRHILKLRLKNYCKFNGRTFPFHLIQTVFNINKLEGGRAFLRLLIVF